MSALLPIERAVIEKLLDGGHPVLTRLREQFSRAVVVERDYTGHGFFLSFAVDKSLAIEPGLDLPFGDVHGEVEGVEHGTGFVLFIVGGLLTTLEGYVYAGDWPEEAKAFRLSYIVNGRPSEQRDHAALHHELGKLTTPRQPVFA